MQVVPLLLGTGCLSFQQLAITPELITISAVPSAGSALCTCCGQPSSRVHSRYTRMLADLPSHGIAVRLQVTVRRFFCDTPDCQRSIFAERLNELTQRYARKTTRLVQSLYRIGLALGGAAGSKLAAGLCMACSGSALLRMIRRRITATAATPRVLGIDDWAFRRGQHYGTILCDLERHCPIDLLPDRDAETLTQWLQRHPGVKIISRDRAGAYAQGARAGAPQAVQVADRFHLMHNLQDALKRLLERQWRVIRDVAKLKTMPASPVPVKAAPIEPVGAATAAVAEAESQATPTLRQQRSLAARERRKQRHQQVMELHQQGVAFREIGRRLNIHRETVARFVQAGEFPERAPRRYAARSDTVADTIRQRWQEGCHNARQIARELMASGFKGSYYMVRRRLRKMRLKGEIAAEACSPPPAEMSVPLSPNRLSWLLLKEENELDEQERVVVEAVGQQCIEVMTAQKLIHEFRRLAAHRQGDQLDDWVNRATAEGAPREISSFAGYLRQDYDAVKAGLTLEWNHGQVEGQVNRLKMLKRQMYGRAGFDLLRARVLRAG